MLLAAALASRDSFQLINNYIEPRRYNRPFQIVWDKVVEYYTRDAGAAYVQPEIVKALLADVTRSDKHLAQFNELLDNAAALDISEANIRQAVLEAKKQEVQLALAAAIAEGRDHKDLLQEYVELVEMTDLDEVDKQDMEVVNKNSLKAILEEEQDDTNKMVVYPRIISEHIGGGIRGGHHIVVYGMSESGKTALVLTIAAGFARQGHKGLYFGNEDRSEDMLVRIVSCLTGLTKPQILADVDGAIAAADAAGLGNIEFVKVAPGTPKQLEEAVEKYQPKWIVIDQLRNLAMKSDNRVVQLEAAATAARNIAKKHNVAVISVTQAGESARDKPVLDAGDVDFSNVGIPAQADVMIGIGTNATLENQGVRMISLPKNKLSGDHSSFPVKLNPHISRYTSV